MGRKRKHKSRERQADSPNPAEAGLEALLAAVRERPDEDGPRLALAAWLEEQGDSRGEMVRLSVELAHTQPGSPRVQQLFEQFLPWLESGDQLVAWIGALGEEGVSAVPERGLLRVRVMNGVDPEEQCDPLFWTAVHQGWVERVDFVDGGGTFRALARGGWWSLRSAPRITALAQPETEDEDLGGVGTLTNLRELTHNDYEWGTHRRLTDRGLSYLQSLSNVERIELYGHFSPDGALGLAALPGLRSLRLDGVTGDRDGLTVEFHQHAPQCQVCWEGI